MGVLSITYPSFIPFTTILSSQVNQNFDDIVTWANGNVMGSAAGPSNITAGSITDTELAPGTITAGSILPESLTGGPGGNIALDTITTENLDPALETLINNSAASGRLLARLAFTVSGSFTKATYPTAERIDVQCVGGGGGGGACQATGAGEESMGSFGGAGAWASRSIDVATLSASETVTVGAGGAAGGFPGAAGTGGASSFAAGEAYQVVAPGGEGGNAMSAGIGFTSSTGGDGGANSGTDGDLTSGGNAGENATRVNEAGTARIIPQGTSGDGFFGGAVRAPTPGLSGINGDGYGSGASGGRNGPSNGSNRPGGTGSGGIVIVEVYA
jgi:hypothetical protein